MTAHTHRCNPGNPAARPESLTGRMRQFFLDNPDEELSTADIMDKFGVTRQQVNDMRKGLSAEGLIETVTITRSLASRTRRPER